MEMWLFCVFAYDGKLSFPVKLNFSFMIINVFMIITILCSC